MIPPASDVSVVVGGRAAISSGSRSHCVAAPSTLHALPDEMLCAVISACALRDITNVACIDVRFHHLAQSHPVIRLFALIQPPSTSASLMQGLEQIRALPWMLRPPLMREYAYRMETMANQGAADIWKFYLHEAITALPDDGSDAHCVARRDLAIARLISLNRVDESPMLRYFLLQETEVQMDALPMPFRADIVGAMLALQPGTHDYDRHVYALVDDVPFPCERPPMQVIALMATLQLFDTGARHVGRAITRRFAVRASERFTVFEPLVIALLASRFVNRGSVLGTLLARWGGGHRSLVPGLHQALLLKAAESVRNSMVDFLDRPLGHFSATVYRRATERVLGIPPDGTDDLLVLREVMAPFWTCYWAHGGKTTFRSRRTAWLTVLQLPWQAQPTLLARLACRIEAVAVSGAAWWGSYLSRDAWEQRTITTCIANDRPRLAVRALLVGCHLTQLEDHLVQSEAVRRALDIATACTPAWSWNELVEAVCAQYAMAQASFVPGWPGDVDVGRLLHRFLSSSASWMVAPSQAVVCAISRHVHGIWPDLPERSLGSGGWHGTFCDRFDIPLRDRWMMKVALTHHDAGRDMRRIV